MLMDISSEMIHALLPIYMVSVLGASTFALGLIEGAAEATASIVKVFSGALSDWLGRRKLLAALGYGLGAATKPIVPLASSLGWLVAARLIDRVGKGIRGAPRDALVADLAPAHLRGASFGLRQSLDTIGGFLGPLLAIGLMWLTRNDFRAVFWVAVIPAFLSVGLILAAVSDPERRPGQRQLRAPLRPRDLGLVGAAYWGITAVGAVFTLARFSEAFLILRARSLGLPLPLIPLVLVVMSLAYSLSAYPAGRLSDRTDRMTILIVGLTLLIAADVVLAFATGLFGLGAGLILWGLHMGFTQGLLASLVAETAPAELRGTAFGLFNLVTGVALLLASAIAGTLWDLVGPSGAFLAGAAWATLAAAGVLPMRARLRRQVPGSATGA
jgi:MFS family permease